MAVEQLFPTFKPDGNLAGRAYDPSDPDQYENFIQAMINDSRDYEGTTLAADRDYAQKYYYGMLPTLGEPVTQPDGRIDPGATFGEILNEDQATANRSSFVSTDVRDAVLLMMPSLIRLFAASENVVTLIPRTQADVDIAEQQTNYINYVFWQDNPGFLTLYGAFKDALTVRTGFVKWWTDDKKERRRKTFVGINDQQLAMLHQAEPTMRVVNQGELDPMTKTYDRVVIDYEVDKPLVKVAGVPPEEMRLDRWATSFATSRLVGHERIVPLDELVAMGYDREEAAGYVQSQSTPEFTLEPQLRNPGRYNSATRVGDGVLYGEWYIKADRDGDGIAELRYICTMGEEHRIVADEEANRVKFAHFGCDPRSHTIVGNSIADYVEDLQRIKTNMTRAVLDSAAESINPKTVINELMVNVDDAMNDDLGAIIRTRGDPATAVQFANTPFLGAQMLPLFELINDVFARRTGLTDAAKGLDPKALQSSTQIGVEAVINGAQERIELVARVLAETGFKDLFTGLYNEISEAPNQRRTLRINGKWSDIDTSAFDASMGVEVNSTLGKGSDTVRMMTLTSIKQTQEQIFQMYGPQNPVVGIPEYLNTITDMLALGNIKNPGKYFKTPDPQTLQMIQSQPKEPDAMTLAAKAQYEKVKSDTAQAIGDQQLKMAKQTQDDDFRHAQLRQKTAYDAAQIALDQQRMHLTHAAATASTQADIHGNLLDHKEAFGKNATDLYKAGLEAETARMQPPPGEGDGAGS